LAEKAPVPLPIGQGYGLPIIMSIKIIVLGLSPHKQPRTPVVVVLKVVFFNSLFIMPGLPSLPSFSASAAMFDIVRNSENFANNIAVFFYCLYSKTGVCAITKSLEISVIIIIVS
jgi:hypothetical protein